MTNYTIHTVTLRLAEDVGERLDRPETAGPFCAAEFQRVLDTGLIDETREVFGFLALDGRHRLLGVKLLALGSRRSAPVDAAELFRAALLLGASGLVLWHTHPSGVLDPSGDDLELTRRLVAGGKLIGVDVLDHFVLDPRSRRWASLRTTHAAAFAA